MYAAKRIRADQGQVCTKVSGTYLEEVMLQMLTLAQTAGQSGVGGGESTLAHSLLTVSEARGHGVGFQPITSSQFYGQLSMTWVKRPARTEPCQHMCPPVRAHFL